MFSRFASIPTIFFRPSIAFVDDGRSANLPPQFAAVHIVAERFAAISRSQHL
jgi:hypothetical protein